MRFFRQIIRDAMSGGVLAGLIAVMLLLQGGISGYAQASMLSLDGAVEIICTSSGGGEHHSENEPFDGKQHPCCQTACHIAASLLPGLPGNGVLSALYPEFRDGIRPDFLSIGGTPRLLGLTGDVRGPPRIS